LDTDAPARKTGLAFAVVTFTERFTKGDPSMNYLGADVHSLSFTLAHINHAGQLCRVYDRDTSEYNLIEVVDQIPGPKTLVVEESHMAQWVKHTLEPRVDRLVVCDPMRNHWIARDEYADDRSSAVKLGKLLFGGYIKEIYHPDDRGAALRRQFLHYFDLSREGARFKCKLQSIFRQVAIVASAGLYDPQQRKGWLEKLSAYPDLKAEAEHLFNSVEFFATMKDEAYVAMVDTAKKQPGYELLIGIPGIGPVLAGGYLAILDTPHRFSKKNKLWRYSGLGNHIHISDGQVYSNRPSRSGNRVLKWTVHQQFNHAVLKSKNPNRFKRQYQAHLERGLGRKTARRQVCRSLLSTVRAVWMKEQPYRDDA
jgi:hypothetical protein